MKKHSSRKQQSFSVWLRRHLKCPKTLKLLIWVLKIACIAIRIWQAMKGIWEHPDQP